MLHANTLDFDKAVSADYQVLRGDVRFRQDSSYMFCDSAYLYEDSNSFDAFGNVRMEQGDTLFVYGDVLYYDGNTGLARLRDNVKMINRDVILTTDSLNYDRLINIGYFFDGGELKDPQNTLTSIYGQYSPDTKLAIFQYDVELVNPQYTLYSDTLQYSTENGMAYILGESVIVSDSNTIYSDLGWYDTRNDLSMLLDRSQLVSKGQVLIGDTIYYNRQSGFGEVFGNMFMNDSTNKIILEGQYGYYNEITEFAFVTDNPIAIEYSTTDSLFLHADTLKSEVIDNDRYLQAYYGVRFFRPDLQGVCDSLTYSAVDSMITMFENPVVWNEDYQIFGDTIFVFMNDSTIDRARVKDFAFLAQLKTENFFDQMSGKIMDAYFRDGELYQLDMNGNVQTIFFPEENDKSYIGLNKVESSFLTSHFKDRQLERVKMWPSFTGGLTPIPMLSPEILHLPNFRWYKDLRPTSKDDIYRKIKMSEEEQVKGMNLFSKEELEGTEDL